MRDKITIYIQYMRGSKTIAKAKAKAKASACHENPVRLVGLNIGNGCAYAPCQLALRQRGGTSGNGKSHLCVEDIFCNRDQGEFETD